MKKTLAFILIAWVLAIVSTPVSAQKKQIAKTLSKGSRPHTGFKTKPVTYLGPIFLSFQQQGDNKNNMGICLGNTTNVIGGFTMNDKKYSHVLDTFGPKIDKKMLTFFSAMMNNETLATEHTLEIIVLDSLISEALINNNCDDGIILITNIKTGMPFYDNKLPTDSSCPTIMRAVVYLAALEHGAKPSDVMDTKDGQYVCINADTVRDSNWRRGGYGEMSLDVAFARNSDVAMAMAIDKYLPNKYETLDSLLNMMGFTERGTIKNYRDMKELKLHPIEMLYWINSVVKDEQPNISAINMHYLREAMCLHVEEGMGKGAKGAEMPIAGMTFVTHNDDMPSPANDRSAIFIGFFPAGNPCYSIYAEVHRKNFITSKIPAEICKDIVNAMSVFWNYEDFSIQNMMRRIQKEQYNEIPMTLTIPKNLQKEKAINEE